MKPGNPAPGTPDAFREFVASCLGRWIAVRIPTIELYVFQGGPTALSMMAGQTVLKWSQVIDDPTAASIKPDAVAALASYSNVIVLDALIGAEDRWNAGNHIYVQERAEWFSIDYSGSFNPNFEAQQYFPEIRNAVQQSTEVVRRAVTAASNIPDEALERLFALPDSVFLAAEPRRSALAFVKERRSRIADIVNGWLRNNGIPLMGN
jgi:hypothetical protein